MTILLNPDTPAPRCTRVTASQELRVVNTSNAFGQPGRTVTVTFGPFAPRQLPVGAATIYTRGFGEYLMPGVHDVRISPYYAAEIWLGSW